MRQRNIVEGIRGIGGEVEYDDEFDRSGDQPGWREPSGPKWLRKLLGHDFFSGVCVVVLANDRVTNGHLERISTLKGLQWLSLQDASITDTGLEQLKGLTQLTLLDLGNTQVTDAGVGQLKGLSQLTILNLCGTQVTDAGVGQLKGLTQLRELDLRNTRVTDSPTGATGLARVRAASNIRLMRRSSRREVGSFLGMGKGVAFLVQLGIS
jgi:hypothetical protein